MAAVLRRNEQQRDAQQIVNARTERARPGTGRFACVRPGQGHVARDEPSVVGDPSGDLPAGTEPPGRARWPHQRVAILRVYLPEHCHAGIHVGVPDSG